jgi:hypothetical protein
MSHLNPNVFSLVTRVTRVRLYTIKREFFFLGHIISYLSIKSYPPVKCHFCHSVIGLMAQVLFSDSISDSNQWGVTGAVLA